MKKLLTLSAIFSELNDYVTESHNIDRAWDILFEHAELLKETVSLSHFVPCVDGVPVSEPNNYDHYNGHHSHFDENLIDSLGWSADELNQWTADCKAYEQAKKAVLFSGWEYVDKNPTEWLIRSGNYWIGISQKAAYLSSSHEFRDGVKVLTFADLAEATKDNPLPML